MNITTKDMDEFYSVITMELGNSYINYANKYLATKKSSKPHIILDGERHEIIADSMIATANFYLKTNKKDKKEWEKYFYVTISNIVKKKSFPKSKILNFVDDYFDYNFIDEFKDQAWNDFSIKSDDQLKECLVSFYKNDINEQLAENQKDDSKRMSDLVTMNEIDNWLKERLRQGKIVPIDYSIFRVRHILGRTVIEIAEKLGYSKSFVRLRCNNIKNYIKEELKYEFND